jgi:thiamine biosynthesis lipoprotein
MKIITVLFSVILFNSFSQKEPFYFEGNAQGTTFHITYYDSLERDFQIDVLTILDDFDQSLSTYIPNSIISRINRGEENVKVDKYFITCFNQAKEIWKSTKGNFDPTVYPLVNAWGFGPGKKQKIEKEIIDSLLQFVGFDLIELKGEYVKKKDPRVSLDFNAFAQGYSVDVVSDFFKSKGLTSFIVEIGGEVYAQGKQENGQNWLIGIEQPYDNKETGNPLKEIIKLENLAVATSGNNRRFFIEDGIKYAHHIDPKTGYPAKNTLLSASIFADKCIVSDATATGILVMGLEKAKKYLKKHKEIEAYLIYFDDKGNFQIYETPGFRKLVFQE